MTILFKDEVTATSAEALGVMTMQLLGMALSDIRYIAELLGVALFLSFLYCVRESRG